MGRWERHGQRPTLRYIYACVKLLCMSCVLSCALCCVARNACFTFICRPRIACRSLCSLITLLHYVHCYVVSNAYIVCNECIVYIVDIASMACNMYMACIVCMVYIIGIAGSVLCALLALRFMLQTCCLLLYLDCVHACMDG